MATRQEQHDFYLQIEQLVQQHQCNYIDAVIMYCDKTGLEYEVASTLVNSHLKGKLKRDAQDLNLLERSGRLPL